MEGFHDRLNDGQPYPVPPIFSCMRFVYFIELIPQFRHIFLRYGFSAVEDRHTYFILPSDHTDFDPPLVFHMVDGVRQIIPDHLFGLKLIRPYIYRLVADKADCRLRLLDQDLAA